MGVVFYATFSDRHIRSRSRWLFMCMRLKNWYKGELHQVFTKFCAKHCINILCRKNNNDPTTFMFELDNRIIQLSLDCLIWLVLSNRKWTGFTTCFPKRNRYHVTGTRTNYISVSDGIKQTLSCQCNLTAQR